MKQVIYFLSAVLVLALSSCSGQYDSIDQYATDETVYVGKYTDIDPGAIKIGYNRIEIDLTDESTGRVSSDEMYMGKAKRTIVEYEEANVRVRKVFDSVCSWVNVTGLTSPKTYIINIYTEDGRGNRSVGVEALGKPFTDSDLAGISFPLPNITPTPTSVDCRWPDDTGLTSSLYRFVSFTYSYVFNGETVSQTLGPRDTPQFNVSDMSIGEGVSIALSCRIIPIMESGRIMDTVTIRDTITVETVSVDEYLRTRTLRPIESALVNPDDPTEGVITLGPVTQHLYSMEIRYKKTDGTFFYIPTIYNSNSQTIVCEDIARNEKFSIRCAYNPPGTTSLFTTDWVEYSTFMEKYENINTWTVLPNNGYHDWTDQKPLHAPYSDSWIWPGGHPMLLLDSDTTSGWHSRVGAPLPQALIIDMKQSNPVAGIRLYGNFKTSSTAGQPNGVGYWSDIEVYVTDALPTRGYTPYTVDWTANMATRTSDYSAWIDSYIEDEGLFAELPVASWGNPLARKRSMGEKSMFLVSPQVRTGRYLIVLFPSSIVSTYICAHEIEVYK